MGSSNNLIWIDLEMTGLDTMRDYIIEIATVVTDVDLNVLAEGPSIAVHQPEAVLLAMDEWNTNQHRKSGLFDRAKNSETNAQQAQAQTLAFLRTWCPAKASPMCGNSICQDRRFLARLMPELEAYFHYRNLDVSSIKELVWRWLPALKPYEKGVNHLALADVRESIEELRYYREHVFKC
jgi:oligoribonuclease